MVCPACKSRYKAFLRGGETDLGVSARTDEGLQLAVAAYGARQPSPLDSVRVVAELSEDGVAAGIDALKC